VPQYLPKLLQTVIDGISVGSLYALIALGYTLVYGILQFINFAHSDVFALGAWLTWAIAHGLIAASGAHPLLGNAITLAILVPLGAVLGCSIVGFLIERFAYRPLRDAPRLNVLIAAIGVSLLLENVGQLPWAFGPYPKSVPAILPDRVLFTAVRLRIWGAALTVPLTMRQVQLGVLVSAMVLMIVMERVIYHTRLGLAMRAVSYNHNIAALMGVNVDRVVAITFVSGTALAAAAGFLFSMRYGQLQQTASSVWALLGLKAFVAAVVGGIGNVRGAMLGGILIGLVEFFGAAYLSSDYRDVYVFAVLILVLLLRPQGLLGRATVEKV
jgi:branched-chain amino acid transport system permease protein